MTAQAKDPHSPSDLDSDGHTRKRVCKACDRCRLKKSKCDGASPCNRCQTDNAICVFGERKKAHDKVYPKGYVEMLEQQQEKLVNAIRELYSRLERNESWPGSPLQKTAKGFPLTHDILERLGMLRLGPDEYDEPFVEDTDMLLRRAMIKPEENAYPTPATSQSDFSPQNSEIVDMFPSSTFGTEMTMPLDQFPPTPLSRTPEEQLLDAATQYAWQQGPVSYPEGINLYTTYDITQQYNALGNTRDGANPCLPTYNEDPGYTGFG